MWIRVANQAGRLVAATTTRTVPTGISASDHPGAMTAASVASPAIRKRPRVQRDAERDGDEGSDEGEGGVGADNGGRDLAGCEPDRLEDAKVSDALAHREQDDRDQGRECDQEQDCVERVDEEQQFVREVAGLRGRSGVERRVE